MKILQLCGFYPPTEGGIENYVKNLSRMLAKKNKVIVIARYIIGKKPKKRIEKHGNLRIIWLVSKNNTKLSTFFSWCKAFFIAMREDFDIVHAHTVLPITMVADLLKFFKKCRVVCTIHESHFLIGLDSKFYRIIVKSILKYPDVIYTASEEIREKAMKLTRRKDIIYLSNAVDEKKFYPKKNTKLHSMLNIPKNKKIIICIRRLVPKNGVLYLAKAIKQVVEYNKKVHFVIIGDGPEKGEIIKQIKKDGCMANVSLMGQAKNDIIPQYLNSASLFVLPSLMEATSIAGLEAMACGLPLVGTNVGGIPDIIEDGVNGLLCRPKDDKDIAKKIIKILDMDLESMGEKSRKIVEERFTWKELTKKIIKLYENEKD